MKIKKFKFKHKKLFYFYKNKINKNYIVLYKIYRFIQKLLSKKGKILFILPSEENYLKINKKIVKIIKKNKQIYRFDIKNKPGFLTNLSELNNQTFMIGNKRPNLIFILSNNLISINPVIKESLLLKIPIISIFESQKMYPDITFPIIAKLNKKILIFFYFFIANILTKK